MPAPPQSQNANDSAASEFRPQMAPQPMSSVVGRVLGRRSQPTVENHLPPIESQVSIPTGELPPGQTLASVAAPPPPPITVDKALIEEAEAKAKEIIAAAQQQARQLMAQAGDKIKQAQAEAAQAAEAAKEQARQQGMEEGKIEGHRLCKQGYVDMMLQARDLYCQAIQERQKLIDSTEPELARLAISIAEKIIGEEIHNSGDVIMGVVKEALGDMKDREDVRIRVSPDDYHIVNADRTALSQMVEGLKDFELVIDSKVEAGGCIIETNLGNIDARLSTQLQAIRAMFERIANGEEAGDGDDTD